jgi:multisubunit Na+/H+ antiporter MnhF subunit
MNGVGITSAMASSWLAWAANAGYVLLVVALLLGLWRAARGPRLSDRLAALKHAWLVSIGFIAVLALQTHAWRILDLALAFALLGGVVPLASAWAGRRRSIDERIARQSAEAGDAHTY